MGLLTETRRTFAQAAVEIGVAVGTVRDWHSVGVYGTKLKALRIGRNLYTSKEAILWFVQKINPDVEGARHDRDSGTCRQLLNRQEWSAFWQQLVKSGRN